MTDWLMVIITTIYVIATILICVFNYRSAKASKEQVEQSQKQLEESKRQFEMMNKPIVSIEFVQIRRVFYALRFTNYGNQPAFDLQIIIDNEFIDTLDNDIKDIIRNNNSKKQNLNCGNTYDLYLGNREQIRSNLSCITGRFAYKDSLGNQYEDIININPKDYATFFTPQSDTEDIMRKIDEHAKTIRELNQIMRSMIDVSKDNSNKDNIDI